MKAKNRTVTLVKAVTIAGECYQAGDTATVTPVQHDQLRVRGCVKPRRVNDTDNEDVNEEANHGSHT